MAFARHSTRRGSRLLVMVAAGLMSTNFGMADEAPEFGVRSAGDFTVMRSNSEAYAEPAPVLDYKQRERFMAGRVFFAAKWVVFPSLGGEWGLGPTFISDRCTGCHIKAGRGGPPAAADEELLSVLVRISIPGVDEHGGPKPHPTYGDQIRNQGLQGKDKDHFLGDRVPPEASLFLDWEEVPAQFADGEVVNLRKPKLRIEKLTFGPLGADTMYSVRMAQPIFGLGLLEAVPESTLLALADRQKAVGYNGRPNRVWDHVNKREAVGRFGWKSNQPSIRQQIAAAFLGDLGVTSSIFQNENCPPAQALCAAQPPGNNPELIDHDWNNLEFWTRGLGVPARRDVDNVEVRRGA